MVVVRNQIMPFSIDITSLAKNYIHEVLCLSLVVVVDLFFSARPGNQLVVCNRLPLGLVSRIPLWESGGV